MVKQLLTLLLSIIATPAELTDDKRRKMIRNAPKGTYCAVMGLHKF